MIAIMIMTMTITTTITLLFLRIPPPPTQHYTVTNQSNMANSGTPQSKEIQCKIIPKSEVTFLPFLSFSAISHLLTGSFDKNHNCYFFVKASDRCFAAEGIEQRGMVTSKVFHDGQ